MNWHLKEYYIDKTLQTCPCCDHKETKYICVVENENIGTRLNLESTLITNLKNENFSKEDVTRIAVKIKGLQKLFKILSKVKLNKPQYISFEVVNVNLILFQLERLNDNRFRFYDSNGNYSLKYESPKDAFENFFNQFGLSIFLKIKAIENSYPYYLNPNDFIEMCKLQRDSDDHLTYETIYKQNNEIIDFGQFLDSEYIKKLKNIINV